jgi:hypothetical protein
MDTVAKSLIPVKDWTLETTLEMACFMTLADISHGLSSRWVQLSDVFREHMYIALLWSCQIKMFMSFADMWIL